MNYSFCATVIATAATMHTTTPITVTISSVENRFKMASSGPSWRERLGDGRKLGRRNHAPRSDSPVSNPSCVTAVTQQSSNVRGQALPATMPATTSHPSAESESAFAEITNGFLLTCQCTMDQAKTMASKLSGYKVDNVPWRYILNNATSTRPKQCGGPTCGPIRDLLHYHRISELKKDPQPFLEPKPPLPTWSDDFTKHLQECPDAWTCAILDIPKSFLSWSQSGSRSNQPDYSYAKGVPLSFQSFVTARSQEGPSS